MSCVRKEVRRKEAGLKIGAHVSIRRTLLMNIFLVVVSVIGDVSLALAQEKTYPSGAEQPEGETWVVAVDGSGHFTSIQDAIDQARNGDAIFIKAGNYTEDVTVHSKERLKVIGEGMKKVFIAGLNRVGTLHIGKWPYGATNVEISGMTIQQHGGLGVGIFNGAGVLLRDIHVNGLIFGQQVQRVRIENCVVGGSETTGMAFADSEVALVGNIIHDNDHGVTVGGTSKVELRHNVITRSLFEAVLVTDNSQARLVQNTLVNNGGGVKFQDDSSGEILGNIITGSKVGVAYSSQTKMTRSHNAFYNNGANDQINGIAVASASTNTPAADLYAQPHFVAPERGDFRLQSDSPLVGVGEFAYLGALAPIAQ